MRAEVDRGGEGRARVVAVLGEAGLGKTRLVEEIVAEAGRDGVRLIQGRSHESERILPFGLWVGALRASHALGDAELLKALGAPWRQELARLFPEIGTRPGPARAGIDDHLRIFQAVGELLSALARRGRSRSSWRTCTGPTRRASGSPPSWPAAWPARRSPSCSPRAWRRSTPRR